MHNLIFKRSDKGYYHTIFKNQHGRQIYMSVILVDGWITIKECFYLDRVDRPEPKRLATSICKLSSLLDVIKNELDKSFKAIQFDDSIVVSKDTLISTFLEERKKKILIMLADGDVLRTVFKSKYRREIYLEITLSNDIATITQCYYVDKRANGKKIIPHGLITVRFHWGLQKLLETVNNELEGGFSGVLISSPHHTITLDRPICGSI